jgi:membrane protease YdiL (CAAX protease family)
MESQRKNIVTRFPLLSFFLLAYAINCLATFISAYIFTIPKDILWFFQVFSPTLSAVIVTMCIGGWNSVKKLFSGFARLKVSIWWYLSAFSLALFPLFFALVYNLLGFSSPGLQPGMTIPVLLSNLIYTLFSGPVAEEAGWRGFALPRLQKRFGALVSSLILGTIWACWHLPFYAISGGGAGLPFPIYFVMVLVVTVFITWIYNNTKGSLLLCVFTHFAFNFSSAFIAGYLGLLPPMIFQMGCGAMLGIYVIVIIVVFGPKRLSRKPVGEAIDNAA